MLIDAAMMYIEIDRCCHGVDGGFMDVDTKLMDVTTCC